MCRIVTIDIETLPALNLKALPALRSAPALWTLRPLELSGLL